MSEKPAMTDDEIETLAWDLEVAMMEIRKDPRAALTAGLAGVRTTMLAEYKADMAKRKADLAKADAEFLVKVEAAFAAKMSKIEAEFEAKLRAKVEAVEAKFAKLMAELRAASGQPEPAAPTLQ
jgi:inorganic pyrophosphatase/exopolyphosphatase